MAWNDSYTLWRLLVCIIIQFCSVFEAEKSGFWPFSGLLSVGLTWYRKLRYYFVFVRTPSFAKFAYYRGVRGPVLEIFRRKMKKIKFFLKVSKWLNSQSYLVRIETWAHFAKFAYYRGVTGPVLENFRQKMKKIFFWNSPNDSIRKVNLLKSKFEHLLQHLPTTQGVNRPSQKYSVKNENKVLGRLYWKNEIVLESVLKCTWISSYFWVATLLNACRFSTIGERNVHSKGFSQENCCSLIIHENRWSFLAIFIHLINLIKFNRFSKSNMVTGLTGLTITDVEPVDKVPRYSSQRQLRSGF